MLKERRGKARPRNPMEKRLGFAGACWGADSLDEGVCPEAAGAAGRHTESSGKAHRAAVVRFMLVFSVLRKRVRFVKTGQVRLPYHTWAKSARLSLGAQIFY
jgi:hypothetical protein